MSGRTGRTGQTGRGSRIVGNLTGNGENVNRYQNRMNNLSTTGRMNFIRRYVRNVDELNRRRDLLEEDNGRQPPADGNYGKVFYENGLPYAKIYNKFHRLINPRFPIYN